MYYEQIMKIPITVILLQITKIASLYLKAQTMRIAYMDIGYKNVEIVQIVILCMGVNIVLRVSTVSIAMTHGIFFHVKIAPQALFWRIVFDVIIVLDV